MENWTKQNGGVFLRYADDCVLIIYSQRKDKINAAKTALKRAIESGGFIAHPDKNYVTRLNIDSPAAEIVGAKVRASEVKTRKKFRRKIRALRFQLKRRYERNLYATLSSAYKHLYAKIEGLTSYSIYLSSMPLCTNRLQERKKIRC
jgi:hypothetical protein